MNLSMEKMNLQGEYNQVAYKVSNASQMANFGQFLAKMGKTGFFSKKPLEHFFRC